MKTFSQILFLLAIAGMMAACKGQPKGDKADTKNAVNTDTKTVNNTDGTEYKVNEGGTLAWEGTKVLQGKHNGTINIQSGNLKVNGNKIVGGEFLIDMNSIADLSVDKAEMKAKLEGHLKSPDFFDVAKYPTSKFEVTSVTALSNDADANHIVSGNLTMKDKTKNITFKANVKMDGAKVAVSTPAFVIDRTNWDVQYGSGKFFDNLTKDKIINDNIGLSLNFTASK